MLRLYKANNDRAMNTYKEEFLSLLRSYQGIIHKVNLIYFPVSEDREDNFQEVVYNMWKAYPALKNRDKIASWIYATAINTSVSKIRKDSRYIFPENLDFMDICSTNSVMESSVDFQLLLNAVRKLKEIDRSIILLYIEDYSYGEIAEIIGRSCSNVGVRISRAKKQLENFLK